MSESKPLSENIKDVIDSLDSLEPNRVGINACAVAETIGHLCDLIESGRNLCRYSEAIHNEVFDLVRVLKDLVRDP